MLCMHVYVAKHKPACEAIRREASWEPRPMLLLGVVGPLTYMTVVLALGIFRRAAAAEQDLVGSLCRLCNASSGVGCSVSMQPSGTPRAQSPWL